MTVFRAMPGMIVLFFANTKEPAGAGRNELQPWSDGAKEGVESNTERDRALSWDQIRIDIAGRL